MRLIDRQYTATPFYGTRRMTACLRNQGHTVNRKRVSRLMKLMGIEAIYPRRRLSQADAQAKKYPYLFKGLSINRPDHVWATDITYIRMRQGFIYLMAIMDWFSRYVLTCGIRGTYTGFSQGVRLRGLPGFPLRRSRPVIVSILDTNTASPTGRPVRVSFRSVLDWPSSEETSSRSQSSTSPNKVRSVTSGSCSVIPMWNRALEQG